MKNYNLIQKYLNKEMTSDELAEFKAKVLSDAGLALELELQRQENLALESLALNDIKKKIIELDKKNIKKRINKTYIIIVFAILCTSFIGYLVYEKYFNEMDTEMETKNTYPEKLITKEPIVKPTKIQKDESGILKKKKENSEGVIKEISKISTKKERKIESENSEDNSIALRKIVFKELDDNIVNLRSTIESKDSNSSNKWNEVNNLINDSQFREALSLLKGNSEDYPNFDDVQLLKAQCFMKIGEYQNATIIYDELIADGDEFLADVYQYEKLLSLICQLPNSKSIVNKLFSELNGNTNFTFSKEINNLKLELSKVNFNFE